MSGVDLKQLGQSSAATGQVPAWNGSAWQPASMSANTLETIESPAADGTSDTLTADITGFSGGGELEVDFHLRTDRITVTTDPTRIRFNGDTSSVYESTLYQVDAAASLTGSSNDGAAGTGIAGPLAVCAGAVANKFCDGQFRVTDFRGSEFKGLEGAAFASGDASTDAEQRLQTFGGVRRSTDTITSISVISINGDSFIAGSYIRVRRKAESSESLTSIPFTTEGVINPLHLYQPWIDDAQHRTEDTGLSDIIDVGRASSLLDLSQSTGSLQPSYGTADPVNGKRFADFDGSDDFMQAGGVTDWKFLHNPVQDGATIGAIMKSSGATNQFFLTTTTSGSSSQTGILLRPYGGAGLPGFFWFRGVGSNPVVSMVTAEALVPGLMVVVFRWMELSGTFGSGYSKGLSRAFEFRINGQVVLTGELQNAPATGNSTDVLTVGASATPSAFWAGDLFELFSEDRWIPDNEVAAYEEYAAREFACPSGDRSGNVFVLSDLMQVGTKTGAVTVSPGTRVPVNPSGGGFTVKAPANPVAGMRWASYNEGTSTNTMTYDGNGSDIEDPGGTTFGSTFTAGIALFSFDAEYTNNGKWKIIAEKGF